MPRTEPGGRAWLPRPPLLPGRVGRGFRPVAWGLRVRPPVCDVGGTNLMGFCDSGMRGRMCLVNFGGSLAGGTPSGRRSPPRVRTGRRGPGCWAVGRAPWEGGAQAEGRAAHGAGRWKRREPGRVRGKRAGVNLEQGAVGTGRLCEFGSKTPAGEAEGLWSSCCHFHLPCTCILGANYGSDWQLFSQPQIIPQKWKDSTLKTEDLINF